MVHIIRIVAKLKLDRQISVKNTYSKINDKPTKSLVADTRHLTEVRTEVVCRKGVPFVIS